MGCSVVCYAVCVPPWRGPNTDDRSGLAQQVTAPSASPGECRRVSASSPSRLRLHSRLRVGADGGGTPALSRQTGATIVAYDRAGVGESDLPGTAYGVREELAGFWRGLQQLRFDRSVVALGHSYGGLPIQGLACQQPAAVRGLLLGDPMTLEFIDALGGAEGLERHPLPASARRPIMPAPQHSSRGKRDGRSATQHPAHHHRSAAL